MGKRLGVVMERGVGLSDLQKWSSALALLEF